MTGLNQDKYRILTISVVCGRAHVLFAFSVFVSAQWCLWCPGYGSKKKDKTCVAFNNGSKVEWFNTVCSNNYYYICEANNCKYNITIV
jgi:hypothetical protein